jgi:hypothetical protein
MVCVDNLTSRYGRFTLIPPGGYPPFPPGASSQAQRPRRPFWRSPYAILIGGVVAAVVVVVSVVVGMTVSRDHGPIHAASNAPGNTSAPPPSSTPGQWQASVCSGPPIAPRPSAFLHSAEYSSLCGTTANGVALVYGRYTSQDVMQNDVARFPLERAAATLTAGNAVDLFITVAGNPQAGMAALEPLVQFGFHRYYVLAGVWRAGP